MRAKKFFEVIPEVSSKWVKGEVAHEIFLAAETTEFSEKISNSPRSR